MDLGEVLKTHLGGDQQGQLVIKFVGEQHLCKVSIEEGQAVYLTLGTMGPMDTLDAIVGKVAEWANFIKGLPARKRLDQPINELLFNIAGAAPPAADEPLKPVDEESSTPADISVEGEVAATQIQATVNRFIDLVGPLGTILTEKISSNLAYTEGNPMSAELFIRFVTSLAAEVPDEERQAFIDAASQS